jgi:DNA-3-methyladenine glycosylase
MPVKLKRVYDPAAADDGFRVLVDRVWPRGLTKEKARVDLWLKEVAPTTALRKWFSHDPAKWAEFERRYRKELAADPAAAALTELRAIVKKHRVVTLVYGAKDTEHNQAVVVHDRLAGK